MKWICALLLSSSLAFAYTAKTGIVKGKVDSFDEKSVTLKIDGKKYKVDRKHFTGQTLKVGQTSKAEIDIKELEGTAEPNKKEP